MKLKIFLPGAEAARLAIVESYPSLLNKLGEWGLGPAEAILLTYQDACGDVIMVTDEESLGYACSDAGGVPRLSECFFGTFTKRAVAERAECPMGNTKVFLKC